MTEPLSNVLLAGCRWLVDAGVFGLLGVAGASLVVARLRADSASLRELRASVNQSLQGFTRSASLALVAAWVAMLAAQINVWFGSEGFTDLASVKTMLLDTRWGHAWLAAFSVAVLAVISGLATSRQPARRAWFAAIVPVSAVVATSQIGHAAGRGVWMGMLHAGHLFGAGLWLGTLVVLVWSVRGLWRDGHLHASAIGDLLSAFTPIALTGAGMAAVSGALLTLAHVSPLGTLFTSRYGQILTAKVICVAVMAMLGAINWRWLRPRIDEPPRRLTLRRAMVAEAAIGMLVVLVLTAWLTGSAGD